MGKCRKIAAGTGLCLLVLALCVVGMQPRPDPTATAFKPTAIQHTLSLPNAETKLPTATNPSAVVNTSTTIKPAPITTTSQSADTTGGAQTSTAESLVAAAVSRQERITSDPEGGKWAYSRPELDISVTRERNEEKGFTYYLADIHIKNMSAIQTGFAGENPWKTERKHPAKIAQSYGAVLAINGDFFTASENKKGISIRNGAIYYDKKQKADTLAILPDGMMKVYKPDETTAQALLAAGVQNALSFGPTLVNGRQICPDLKKHKLFPANPRTGIGMVEKGHYIAVVVQGRGWENSRGIDLNEFAGVFTSHGCTVAYNLDGGQSTAMIFMGETLNKHTKSGSGIVFRSVPEVLIFGTTTIKHS